LNRLSALFIAALSAACAYVSSPVLATGLYDDFPSFFSIRDTARTAVVVRQSTIDLVSGRASLLAAEADFGLRRRYEVRLALPFVALRRSGDVDFGVGDATLRGTAVLLGDSLSSRALLLRADARVPTASRDFFPFSADSIALAAGLELRVRLAFAEARGGVLYTMASDRRVAGAVVDGDHLTAAASIGLGVGPRTALVVSAFVARWNAGGSRVTALAAFRQRLARSVEIELCGAVESGTSRERVFDEAFSIALLYRFPGRARAAGPESPPPGTRGAPTPPSGTP